MAKRIILWLSISLCAGMATSMILDTASRAKNEKADVSGSITENPFYDEFAEAGARYGIDVSFTKKAKCQFSMFMDLARHPLLNGEPGTYDVLIVGDSSVAWGLIPEVVEQMTGRKVGVFAYEALTLNAAMAAVISNLVSYYLKDNGLLVLAFGSWTQELPADSIILVHTPWMTAVSRMDAGSFARFMESWRKENAENAENAAGGAPLRNLLYSRYRANMARLRNFLADETGLSLFHIDFYLDHVEPIVNPGWHRKKLEMRSRLICQMRWNSRSIMNYTSDTGIRSRRSFSPPDLSYRNANVARVSSILASIPCRKAYLVNLNSSDATYSRLRSIYHAYYAKRFGLIDLGKEHPVNVTFPMDTKEHMINEGGLWQSILVGECIRRDFRASGARLGNRGVNGRFAAGPALRNSPPE